MNDPIYPSKSTKRRIEAHQELPPESYTTEHPLPWKVHITCNIGVSVVADANDVSIFSCPFELAPYIVTCVNACIDISTEALKGGVVNELVEALKAMVVIMDRGSQPRKLDEALSWRECDDKGRAMADNVLAKLKGESNDQN